AIRQLKVADQDVTRERVARLVRDRAETPFALLEDGDHVVLGILLCARHVWILGQIPGRISHHRYKGIRRHVGNRTAGDRIMEKNPPGRCSGPPPCPARWPSYDGGPGVGVRSPHMIEWSEASWPRRWITWPSISGPRAAGDCLAGSMAIDSRWRRSTDSRTGR